MYMNLPPAHCNEFVKNLVCRLHKSIYDLYQPHHAWYSKLSRALSKLEFTKSSTDSSMLTKQFNNSTIIALDGPRPLNIKIIKFQHWVFSNFNSVLVLGGPH